MHCNHHFTRNKHGVISCTKCDAPASFGTGATWYVHDAAAAPDARTGDHRQRHRHKKSNTSGRIITAVVISALLAVTLLAVSGVFWSGSESPGVVDRADLQVPPADTMAETAPSPVTAEAEPATPPQDGSLEPKGGPADDPVRVNSKTVPEPVDGCDATTPCRNLIRDDPEPGPNPAVRDGVPSVSEPVLETVVHPGSMKHEQVTFTPDPWNKITKRILIQNFPATEIGHLDGDVVSYGFPFDGWYASRDVWLSGTYVTKSQSMQGMKGTENYRGIPLKELYRTALDEINSDREKHGVAPVLLSDNISAQLHAQSNYEKSEQSHWMYNGEKPYMTYSMMDGLGYAKQNVASRTYHDPERCHSQTVRCEKIDPIYTMKKLHHNMMYDDAHANWGHRDNILDPYHTHVSIGVVSGMYEFYFVQHFEGRHAQYEDLDGRHNPIDFERGGFVVRGEFDTIEKYEPAHINVFYDPIPSKDTYDRNSDRNSYEGGDLTAAVLKPLPSGYYYNEQDEYDVVVADKWNVSWDSMDIRFDPIPAMIDDGAYTVVLYLKDIETGKKFKGAERTFYLVDWA